MRIVFDCTSCQPGHGIETNGGGEYSLRVLEELYKRDMSLQIVLLFSQNKGRNKRVEEFPFDSYSYKNISDLSCYLDNIEVDVIVFPVAYPIYGQIKISKNVQIICGIHDLSDFYETIISNYQKRYFNDDGLDWMRSLYCYIMRKKKRKMSKLMHENLFRISKNTHVYTVSYYSKHAIEYYLDGCRVEDVFYSPNKIQNHIKMDTNTILSEFCVEKKSYFLLSNACRWLKNNERALIAFDNLLKDRKISDNIKIVVLGCNENFIKHMKRILTHEYCFIFRNFVKDIELECLYKYAKSFVYPSLLEGFGYPPIEAMKYGTISLCSTSTSIPEITDGNAIYFDPLNIQSIEMAILHSLDYDYMARFEREKLIESYNKLNVKQEEDLNRLINYILKMEKGE